jgi:aconitate hydratase
MGGGAYYLTYPKVVGIRLSGKLPYGVAAKDIILEVLRRLTVKGGVGKVMEYIGEGVKTLTVPERATIANMGAELGATTSIFPSDDVTRAFLKAQGREEAFTPLSPDPDAVYDETIEIDLSALRPNAAMPHMADKVKTVAEIGPIRIDQVCIGSCTNSSLYDMLKVAAILKGKTVAPNVSLSIAPGSKQVLTMLAENGALADMIAAGARILESACGPCIGMGQSPNSGGISLRTFNRNFEGRSGTADAGIYLVSPETAAASAVAGVLTDPTSLGEMPEIRMPERFFINDNMVLLPDAPEAASQREILYGPNIKAVPTGRPPEDTVCGRLLLKVGDNITTDHIMPAGAKILPYRSNVPYLSQFCFGVCDKTFAERAKKEGGGIVVGGANYGQGSSREHAALVPLYLGVRAVIAKSFARMHKANLINSGILPLTFVNEADYEKLRQGDVLSLPEIRSRIADGGNATLVDETTGETFALTTGFSEREKGILLAGGRLNFTAQQN